MLANKPKGKSASGFTIVELIIVLSVTAILSLAFMDVIINDYALITKANDQMDMAISSQNLLRSTVDNLRFGDGVRQTNTLTDPNAPAGGWNTSNSNFVIVIASPALDSSHNYIIDPLTGSPYMNELVYYKNGSQLTERILADPSATGNSTKTTCPANLATSSCPADKILADYVNTMTFTLYDQDNALTTDPTLARSVKIDLGMQRTSFGAVIKLDNSIRVTLRNRF